MKRRTKTGFSRPSHIGVETISDETTFPHADTPEEEVNLTSDTVARGDTEPHQVTTKQTLLTNGQLNESGTPIENIETSSFTVEAELVMKHLSSPGTVESLSDANLSLQPGPLKTVFDVMYSYVEAKNGTDLGYSSTITMVQTIVNFSKEPLGVFRIKMMIVEKFFEAYPKIFDQLTMLKRSFRENKEMSENMRNTVSNTIEVLIASRDGKLNHKTISLAKATSATSTLYNIQSTSNFETYFNR